MIPCEALVLSEDKHMNTILNSLRDSPAITVFKDKWREFAICLKLSGKTINKLNESATRDNWDPLIYFNGVLMEWISKLGKNSKLNIFLNALEECELNDFSDRIKTALLQNVDTNPSNACTEDVHQPTTRQMSNIPDLIRSSPNGETHEEENSESFEREDAENENTDLLPNLPILRDSITETRESNITFQNCSFTSNTQGWYISVHSSRSSVQSSTSIVQPNSLNLYCVHVKQATKKVANLIRIPIGLLFVLFALVLGYKVITKQNLAEQIMLPCKDTDLSFNNCYITKIANYSYYYDTAKLSPKSCETLHFQLENSKDWPLSSTIYNPSCVHSIVLQGYYSIKIFESIIKQTSNVIYLKFNSDNEDFCQNYAPNDITSSSENMTISLSSLKSISLNVTCQDNQFVWYFTDYLGSKNLNEIIVYNYAAIRDLLLVFENVLVDSDMNTVLLDAQRLLVTREQNTSRYESYFNSNTFSGWTNDSKNMKIGRNFCSRFKSLETFIVSDRFFRFNDRFYVLKCTHLRQLYLKLYIESEEICDLKIKLLEHLDIVFIYLHFPNCPSDEQTQLLKIKDINASYRYFVKSNCIIDHDQEAYNIELQRPSLSSPS